MSEASKIGGTVVGQTGRKSGAYREVREVERQATVLKSSDPPQVKTAVTRLDRFIDSGRPFRNDVPRGFYLNIRV